MQVDHLRKGCKSGKTKRCPNSVISNHEHKVPKSGNTQT